MKTTIEITGTPDSEDATKERVVHCQFGIPGLASFRFVWILLPGRAWDEAEKARALQAALHTQRYTLACLFDPSDHAVRLGLRRISIIEAVQAGAESLLDDGGVDASAAAKLADEILAL